MFAKRVGCAHPLWQRGHAGPLRPWAPAAGAKAQASAEPSKLQWADGRRWKATSKNRFDPIRARAAEQHVEYLRQMTPPRPYRSFEVDPKLLTRVADTKQVFKMPHVTRQPSASSKDSLLLEEDALKEALQPEYAGLVGQASLDRFGSIEVHHGNIFSAAADAVILPMMPSLMPYRGLGLEAFDRGGTELVKSTFKEAKKVWNNRIDTDKTANPKEGLLIGDALVVQSRGLEARHTIFVVMPWFWQGSPMDAAKRYRFSVKAALAEATARGFQSVAVPHLGGGVCGYEPRGSCGILIEEAVESMLQVEAAIPNYSLQKVSIVDINKDTAQLFSGALTQVVQRWLPDRQLTTAAEFHSRSTRRLIVLPDAPTFFWKRHRTKFRRKHGVVRNQRSEWLGRIRQTLWRTARVRQPPPFLVYRATGQGAPQELQRKPRPYYFRGVTHWLFPSRRSGYHNLRRSASGHWVASNRPYHLRDDNRPRM